MANTTNLKLPLVAGGQAQKHVTVNETFQRLDVLVQMRLAGVGATVPPNSPAAGDLYALGPGASDAWAGHDGEIAMFLNNGWDFLVPDPGWRAFDAATGVPVTFDGVDWVAGAGSVSPNGAGFLHQSLEIDHQIGVGGVSSVIGAIPIDAVVYGITGRVLADIGGSTSFEIGVSGSTNRYGSGFGVSAGSFIRGVTGTPLAYYAPTDLQLTATGGSFDGSGVLRIAVHYARLTIPRA